MPTWGSEDVDSLDVKPVISPDGSVSNSHQQADGKPPFSPSIGLCPSSQPTALEDATYVVKPHLSAGSGTSNGPAVSESKSNGPHTYNISPSPTEQLHDHQRLSGSSPVISVLSQRQTRPRSGTPPTTIVLPNHVVKTEGTTGPAHCTQRLPGPAPTPPNSCTSPELTSTLSWKHTQTQPAPPLGQPDSRAVGSPLSGTRALTPPQAAGGDLAPAAPGASRLCVAAPPTGKSMCSSLFKEVFQLTCKMLKFCYFVGIKKICPCIVIKGPFRSKQCRGGPIEPLYSGSDGVELDFTHVIVSHLSLMCQKIILAFPFNLLKCIGPLS